MCSDSCGGSLSASFLGAMSRALAVPRLLSLRQVPAPGTARNSPHHPTRDSGSRGPRPADSRPIEAPRRPSTDPGSPPTPPAKDTPFPPDRSAPRGFPHLLRAPRGLPPMRRRLRAASGARVPLTCRGRRGAASAEQQQRWQHQRQQNEQRPHGPGLRAPQERRRRRLWARPGPGTGSPGRSRRRLGGHGERWARGARLFPSSGGGGVSRAAREPRSAAEPEPAPPGARAPPRAAPRSCRAPAPRPLRGLSRGPPAPPPPPPGTTARGGFRAALAQPLQTPEPGPHRGRPARAWHRSGVEREPCQMPLSGACDAAGKTPRDPRSQVGLERSIPRPRPLFSR